MVYNFLCKDEKTRRNIYLLLLKTSVWKEVRHFYRTVYPNRNHVTTHPDTSILNKLYKINSLSFITPLHRPTIYSAFNFTSKAKPNKE